MIGWIKGYLSELTANRALYLFLASFVLGSTLLLSNIGSPFVVAVGTGLIVFIYGLLLWYSQTYLYVGLRPPIKNSPYILGFLLTLVAFFNIFYTLRGAVADGTANPDFLAGQIGAAIFTTIAGLGMRQIIVISDPQEKVMSEIYDDLAEQVRIHWVDFANAQKGFVALIQEFVNTKEKLFSSEEQAFNRYVKNLDANATVMARFEKEYAAHWERLLNTMRTSSERLGEETNKSLTGIGRLGTQIQKELGAFQEVIHQTSTMGAEQSRSLEALGKRITAMASETSGSLADLSQNVRNTSTSWTLLDSKFKQLITEFSSFANQFNSVLNGMGDNAEDTKRLIADKMKATVQDLQAIDSIMDEVATTLRKNLDPVPVPDPVPDPVPR